MTNESYLVRREIYQNLHEKNETKNSKEIAARNNADSDKEVGNQSVAEQRRNYDKTDRSSIKK